VSVLITLRVLLSVSASAMQKRLVNLGAPLLGIWTATYGLMFPLALLASLAMWVRPPGSFWVDSLLGGVLDALGNLAMLAALRAADLSVFGPLNAIRPILALIFGWLFLRETPNAAGAIGILITVGGACFVLKEDRTPGAKRSSAWAVLGFRLLGFALATVASVFLKRAASGVSVEMTLMGWFACGLICLFVYGKIRREPMIAVSNRDWLIVHAITFGVMQWMTIRIFQETLLAYAFVYFQLGMILQVLAGRFFFREPHFGRRLFGCIVMIIGAVIILLLGQSVPKNKTPPPPGNGRFGLRESVWEFPLDRRARRGGLRFHRTSTDVCTRTVPPGQCNKGYS
jgi:drug/metabolite transporter (DMT)-like permease